MTSDSQTLGTSVFFFPLRSNVGFFDSPEGYFSLQERIKQASLLFDTLYFEPGVYTATVWATGSTEFWLPPEGLDDETLSTLKIRFSTYRR